MTTRLHAVHPLPTAAAALLSVCGIGLLILEMRSGVSGWEPIGRQLLGLVSGVWCFATATRRMSHFRKRESSPPLLALMLLVVPHLEVPVFPIDRALVGEIVKLLAVLVIGTMIVWREMVRGPHAALRAMDHLSVVAPACVLTLGAHLLNGLAVAIALGTATAVMLIVAGYRWRFAAVLLVMPLLLLGRQLQSRAVTRGYAKSYSQNAVAVLRDAQSVRLTDWLTSGEPYRNGRWFWLFNLPPDLARNVTLVRVAGIGGLAGVAAVAAVFTLIACHGCRTVRKAERLAERVMIAGMTVALVTPVALQAVGALLLVSGRAGGPLPFVGYGPGELVLHWIMLAYVARHTRTYQPVASLTRAR